MESWIYKTTVNIICIRTIIVNAIIQNSLHPFWPPSQPQEQPETMDTPCGSRSIEAKDIEAPAQAESVKATHGDAEAPEVQQSVGDHGVQLKVEVQVPEPDQMAQSEPHESNEHPESSVTSKPEVSEPSEPKPPVESVESVPTERVVCEQALNTLWAAGDDDQDADNTTRVDCDAGAHIKVKVNTFEDANRYLQPV